MQQTKLAYNILYINKTVYIQNGLDYHHIFYKMRSFFGVWYLEVRISGYKSVWEWNWSQLSKFRTCSVFRHSLYHTKCSSAVQGSYHMVRMWSYHFKFLNSKCHPPVFFFTSHVSNHWVQNEFLSIFSKTSKIP